MLQSLTAKYRQDDWNPAPPDQNVSDLTGCGCDQVLAARSLGLVCLAQTGIWQPLTLQPTPAALVQYPLVETKLDGESAHLRVAATVTNFGEKELDATLLIALGDFASVAHPVRLPPNATSTVLATNETHSALNIAVATELLWWPHQMGTPRLHELRLALVDRASNASLAPPCRESFGLREVTAELLPLPRSVQDAKTRLLFRVNGQKILIRGGGWCPDMFQRYSTERTRAQLAITKDIGLNAIRLEGKLQNDELFQQASELGILMLPGWMCCDAWQRWDLWDNETLFVAAESLRSQVRRLRIQPSVIGFLLGSDDDPPLEVERTFRSVAAEELWPNAVVSGASADIAPETGPTGVKVRVPSTMSMLFRLPSVRTRRIPLLLIICATALLHL